MTSETAKVLALIFDEVAAGIGGRVAEHDTLAGRADVLHHRERDAGGGVEGPRAQHADLAVDAALGW